MIGLAFAAVVLALAERRTRVDLLDDLELFLPISIDLSRYAASDFGLWLVVYVAKIALEEFDIFG